MLILGRGPEFLDSLYCQLGVSSLSSLFADKCPSSSKNTALGLLGASLEPQGCGDLGPHLAFAGMGADDDTDFLWCLAGTEWFFPESFLSC